MKYWPIRRFMATLPGEASRKAACVCIPHCSNIGIDMSACSRGRRSRRHACDRAPFPCTQCCFYFLKSISERPTTLYGDFRI